MVLNQGRFCPLGDIWQHLETHLVATTGRGGAAGIQWAEARDPTSYTAQDRSPTTDYPALNVHSGKAGKLAYTLPRQRQGLALEQRVTLTI